MVLVAGVMRVRQTQALCAVRLKKNTINLTESEAVTRLGDDTDSRLISTSYSGRRY